MEKELRSIESSKEGTYEKRTEHLNEDGSAVFINRLVKEDSPYLLQHAHNPVDWFPWGAEAFEIAKDRNKPIFLSIGYSTCHWCHVMEVESFDNIEVAKVLNANFICIKMDREQYPDIDEIYMTGLQIISGQGGWPMSNFLLTDGKPFFAATYFPPPTFMKLLLQISEAWNQKYSELESSANKISESINRMLGDSRNKVELTGNLNKTVCEAMLQREDRERGGLAGAPKFPQEPLLLFMLDQALSGRELHLLGFVTRALEGMGRGGIYDQVAGGFHRYSVDAEWLVPHFEKMLYNQSQLALLYSLAYRFTGDKYFMRICEQTVAYVLRDMQLPEGGFYSATDADSEGVEGLFFLWTVEEINHALDQQEAQIVIDVFGVTSLGNFEGSNILCLSKSFANSEKKYGEDFAERLDRILVKLYKVREQREHPLRDDKLIVGWASAFITTLSVTGSYLGNKKWIELAEKALRLIIDKCADEDFRLNRIYLNASASIEGQLEDYANLIEALLHLFDITSNLIYLNRASSLMEKCLEEFWNEQEGEFYLSPANQLGPQLTRSRNASDGAIFSPVASAINCLYKLYQRNELISENILSDYKKIADQALGNLSGDINENPMGHTSILRQLAYAKRGVTDLHQYCNQGLAKVGVAKLREADPLYKNLRFNLKLVTGWHIVAEQAESEDYSPLLIVEHETEKHWKVLDHIYPDASGVVEPAGLSRVSIYEEEFFVDVRLIRTKLPDDDLSFSAQVTVSLQLCNDKNCLLPATLDFRI